MPLYEVAILAKPTKKEMEEGEIDKLVFGPSAVVARDQQSAALVAVANGNTLNIDISRCEVLCRPFA